MSYRIIRAVPSLREGHGCRHGRLRTRRDRPAPSAHREGRLGRCVGVSCEQLLYSYLQGNGQMTAQGVEHDRSVNNCLAADGSFPALNVPAADELASERARAICEAHAPGGVAFLSCLRDHGLEVVVDGVPVAGPWAPTVSAAAWQSCRDTYVQWFLTNPGVAATLLSTADCRASKGWLNVLARTTDIVDPSFQAARQACPS